MERSDLTLAEARAETVTEVDTAAARLGTVVVPGKGDDLSCSDLPEEGDPVYYTYGLAVDATVSDVGRAINELAAAYEADGWSRSAGADGRTINLDRAGYRLQVLPAKIAGRIIVEATSPCVSPPDE